MDVHKTPAEKSFKCDLCPKRYSQSYRLNSHKLENHCREEEKQFHCDICGKKYEKKVQGKFDQLLISSNFQFYNKIFIVDTYQKCSYAFITNDM